MSSTRAAIYASTALLVGTLTACGPAFQQNSMPASTKGLEAPARNGARIYFTAASERGTPVGYTGGPRLGGGMMGGFGPWLTCASCHGPEGRGGTHLMHMRVMTAPDIRYAALAGMPELKGRQRAYDIDDFRMTVEQGRHPDGEQLEADMPRWQMSDADLADLFAFLRSLPQ